MSATIAFGAKGLAMPTISGRGARLFRHMPANRGGGQECIAAFTAIRSPGSADVRIDGQPDIRIAGSP